MNICLKTHKIILWTLTGKGTSWRQNTTFLAKVNYIFYRIEDRNVFFTIITTDHQTTRHIVNF